MMTSAQEETIEGLREELAELKQMIREAETLEDLNDLHHKVGGSDQENQEAEERLRLLDELADRCSWEKFDFQCSREELQARQRWQSIMNQQRYYEFRYC